MRVMELHAPVKTVKRSAGRSATAAAAYRAAEKIECERTGQVHDYTRKRGVEDTALLLPDESPEWAHDRSNLWNHAEMREKRKDAQTAREIEVSFPAEFSQEHRRAAGIKIGQWIVHRYGAAADVAWHEPSREGDQRNHHAHVLFTVRRLEKGKWAERKDNPLDNPRTSGEELKNFRGAVAGIMNDISAREKLGVFVEHLSFKSRELDREPTQHMGPIASEMERRGEVTDIGQKNRDIKARNAERDKLYEEQENLQAGMQRKGNVVPFPKSKPEDWSSFYAETTKRRQTMLEKLDAEHLAKEQAMREDMAKLRFNIDHRGAFVRFWRRITGQMRADKEQLAKTTAAYDAIQEKRRLAAEAFEKERVEKMERLKQETASEPVYNEPAASPREDVHHDEMEHVPEEAMTDHIESDRDREIAELQERQAKKRNRGMKR